QASPIATRRPSARASTMTRIPADLPAELAWLGRRGFTTPLEGAAASPVTWSSRETYPARLVCRVRIWGSFGFARASSAMCASSEWIVEFNWAATDCAWADTAALVTSEYAAIVARSPAIASDALGAVNEPH